MMKCPRCGSSATGKFCAECGTPLEGAACAACQASLLPGARFCTQCGTPVRAARPVNPAWYVGAVAVFLILLAILVPLFRGAAPAATASPPAATLPAGAPMGTPPPLTGTMREQADRLFNRIMGAREQGDTAQARFFLPMAITAYQSAGELDADGLYHLSVLQTFSGDASSGQATAEAILQRAPAHLLGLHAAASAARTRGDEPAARRYFQAFLDALPQERTRDLPEYQDHAALIPAIEEEARTFLKK